MKTLLPLYDIIVSMVKVDKIIPGGQTIATLPDGKKILFWGALPGEMVKTFKVTKTKSHYLEAIAQAIEKPSPFRASPKDECYLSTSPWQIMDYQYELSQKQLLVVETFREHQISIPLPPIITDYKDYFYRNKMEYSLYWDNEESIIKPAFHQRGSHCKVPVASSSIERPEIFQAAKNIIDDLNSRGDEARRYQSLLLRCNQKGEISGGLYKNNQPHQIFPNLKDSILKNEYSYSPNGFFQINLPVYEMVLLEIEKNITTNDVLDLYAGVGTIGLSVARERNLTLVEIDKFAFNELSRNCKQVFSKESKGYNNEHTNPKITGEEYLSRRKSPTPVLAKSEEALEYIKSNQTIILDPPRSGCDKKLIEKILEVRPQKIVYLSCNPATQARDIKLLLSEYNIDTIKSYNFFPRTPHIENLVVLTEKAN